MPEGDETEFIEKPKPVAPAATKTETETQTSTTSTSTVAGSGNIKEPSTWLGMSGRFWITFLLIAGLIELPTLYLIVVIYGFTVDATIFMGIFTAYIGVAGMAVGTYLGQNPKPKA